MTLTATVCWCISGRFDNLKNRKQVENWTLFDKNFNIIVFVYRMMGVK